GVVTVVFRIVAVLDKCCGAIANGESAAIVAKLDKASDTPILNGLRLQLYFLHLRLIQPSSFLINKIG
ncbi:hypothetical protein, partial [Kingella kingae]|uniref:hypothetical protein n=1 Tax=Kingella kingae TaxID=504 RepID=UPI001F2CBBD6